MKYLKLFMEVMLNTAHGLPVTGKFTVGHDDPEHDPRHGQTSTAQKQETAAVRGLLPQVH